MKKKIYKIYNEHKKQLVKRNQLINKKASPFEKRVKNNPLFEGLKDMKKTKKSIF